MSDRDAEILEQYESQLDAERGAQLIQARMSARKTYFETLRSLGPHDAAFTRAIDNAEQTALRRLMEANG